jgi:PEGA domain
MRSSLAVALCLLMARFAAAIETAPPSANVYIDSMNGFGSFLAAAFKTKDVPMTVVADRRQADFELTGAAESGDASLSKSILLSQDGTRERASVNLVNLRNGEVVFAYSYVRGFALFGRRGAAEACAKKLRLAIAKGEVNIRAAAVAAGHHAGETTSVPSGEPDMTTNIPPSRQLLPVAIASDPVGARIEIETMYSGKTPAVVKLQPGEYRVSLTLTGYETWEGKLKVVAGEPAAIAAAMKSFRRTTMASTVK